MSSLQHPVLRRVSRDLEKKTGRLKFMIGATLRTKLVAQPPTGTPRDTGFHSASWNMAVNKADLSTPPPGRKSYTPGPQRNIAKIGRDDTVVVSNNGPAIRRLNNGWSQQTPAGFVERAVAETIQEIPRLARIAAQG